MAVLLFPFRLLWSLFVILVPLLGVWVASSMMAYQNGPIWAIILIGALLFPIFPLLWELRAHTKYRRKIKDVEDPKPRLLSFWDRMTLRTLVLNGVFLAGLLSLFPQKGFTAISARGDWMLQNNQEEEAETARSILFASAEKLEWLYKLSMDNPYELSEDVKRDVVVKDTSKVKPPPTPSPKTNTWVKKPDPKNPVEKNPQPSSLYKVGRHQWPLEKGLHPVVVNMPNSVKTSPKDVATYIASKVSDPFMRVKALHDFVADRTAYDVAALKSIEARRPRPSQDAKTVFRDKKGVCEGYARLLAEMGKHTGDEIVYVVGVSRAGAERGSGVGHAWNGVKIEGSWYLIDATWNAGHVNGDTFTKKYKSDYLLTPPELFGINHLPDDPVWQLRKKPITRGEFIRQPAMSPKFYINGHAFVDKIRSQIDVKKTFTLKIKNPLGKRMAGIFVATPGQAKTRCKATTTRGITQLACTAPSSGQHKITIFSGPPRGTIWSVGGLKVNVSP